MRSLACLAKAFGAQPARARGALAATVLACALGYARALAAAAACSAALGRAAEAAAAAVAAATRVERGGGGSKKMEASKAAAIVAAEDCVDAAAERVFERNMLWLFLCPLCLSQVTDVRYLGEVTCGRLEILLTRTRAEIWLRAGSGRPLCFHSSSSTLRPIYISPLHHTAGALRRAAAHAALGCRVVRRLQRLGCRGQRRRAARALSCARARGRLPLAHAVGSAGNSGANVHD